MKSLCCLVSVFFLATADILGAQKILVAAAREYELPLAKLCDAKACQLPNCRCSTTDIPGGLKPKDVPQFVLVTFDDGVNVINIDTYRELIYNRRNRNNCTAGATYYISHEYTDYTLVNELYNHGLEIALHSISHQTPQTYWQKATYDDMSMEFGDQRAQMSVLANIPYNSIKGIRIPFLQMAGNASFQAMSDYGLQYDSSWPTINQNNPGLWPYTLDYASTQECVVPPCPTASIAGVWVLPMVSWRDLNGRACSMVDACYTVPDLSDEDGWFHFIVNNFKRHYFGNRSPFGFYIHEWYISEATNPSVRRAFSRFMDMINNMDDVFMVNSADVIDWVKNPVSLDEYRQQPCKTHIPTMCLPKGCGPLKSDLNKWSNYWMQVCNACPKVYPWLANPLGQ